ncbi:hypothetical protein PYW08_000317 [Mythimna loreyi]|uniref:Uncharacterized protein n=1 Tax=Mythimna loreyi TaxID=667449 RepID=A0ACC2RC50_9NEOP|nr:hypothetical protein PYW08_000317 [Mythimna loreyi]
MMKKARKAEKKAEKKMEKNLRKWEERIKEQNPDLSKRTETATALRMIADLEKRPLPDQVEGIDFKEVYHQLGNALEGKPIVGDEKVLAVLHMAYKHTAARAQGCLNPQMKDFLRKLKVGESFVQEKFPGRPTEDQELNTLRHLSDQDVYNPLKVPEERLKIAEKIPSITAKKRTLKNPPTKVAKK